jgi:DNA helicase-2/ATP-dependent DNA helicase PcrA
MSAMGELGLVSSPGFIERFLKTNRRLKGSMSLDRDRWEEVFSFDDFSINHQIEREILSLHLRYEKRRYNYESDDSDRASFRAEFDATFDLARIIAEPEPRTPLQEMRSWPRQLHALLVDEMHDMNFAMFTIVKTLLETTTAYFCGVGDRDQVIFSNHGAEERFMSRNTDYGDRKIASLPLTTCYRFGASVAMAASGLAGGKKYTVKSGLDTQLSREFYTESGDSDCAALAMIEILRWKRENSHDVSNIAVLLRHSWQSVDIENTLIEAKIFYETHGFDSYLMQPEVLLIRALHAIGTRDYSKLGTKALRERMVETLVFFFGVELSHEESEKESFKEKMRIAKKAALEDGDMGLFIEHVLLKNCSEKIERRVAGAISAFQSRASHKMDFKVILDSIEIDRWVEEVFIEQQRKKDARKYFNALGKLADKHNTIEGFFAILNGYEKSKEVTSNSENTQNLRASNLKRNTLKLALISEVKGLEFDNVLIPHLEDGIFPSQMAFSSKEEENLLYVAMTRAKKNLTLLISKSMPSPLLINNVSQQA